MALRDAVGPGDLRDRALPGILQGEHHDAAGLVTADWLVAHTPLERATYYLCRPKPFLATLGSGLLGLGIPAERVRSEFFGPADELFQAPRQAA